MKPLRLEAEGFTCYRDRQTPLDFTGLSLFAIAGPTGAGKSSILDTMLFALYGEVPRIGKQSIGEFIAHGRDVMAVTLDFRVRGATYRVVRRVKRGRKNALTTTALLSELPADGGPERSVAEGVKPVNEAVERLLGLDFTAFTQTVILPQGDFAKFLRSDGKDQRAILQHLLRHEVFTRMREEAERRRITLTGELAGVERELRAFEAATPEALAAKLAERDVAQGQLARLAGAQTTLERRLAEHRDRRTRTEDVQRLRQQRGLLDARAGRIDTVRAELEAAQRAARVIPRIDAHELATRQHEALAVQRTAAADTQAVAAAAVTSAERQLASASLAAEAIESLTERIRAIDEIKGDLGRRATLQQRVAELSDQRPAADQRATEAAAKALAAREAKSAAAAAVQAAQASVERAGYRPQDQRQFEAIVPAVAQVRGADAELSRLRDALTQRESDLRRSQSRAQAAVTTFERAVGDCDDAERREREAARAFDDAVDQHRAAALRGHLHAGEPCPVCLQVVTAIPAAAAAAPELETLKRARTAAVARVQTLQQQRQAAAETRAAADAAREAAQQARDLADQAVRLKTEARQAWLADIAALLAGGLPLFDAVDDAELLARVDARGAELEAARQAFETATSRLRKAEAEAAVADVTLVRAEGDARVAADERTRLDAELATAQRELNEACERIAAVSTAADPAAERASLAARATTLRDDLQRARQRHAQAQQDAAAAHERLQALAAALEQATIAQANARALLDVALTEASFETAVAATAAVRDAATQQRLDSETRSFDAERSTVLARLADLEPQIAGREVSAEALATVEAEQASAFAAWRAADLAASALAGDCERLAVDVEARKRLASERDILQQRHVLHAEMAADLKGDAFQEYLLHEAFHALVVGASIRMRQMSNRFTLEWAGGDFFVVDHDNAGERRRAETLSGGETFMASLCLALQLSDEVLKTSGALQMDSLFIDEGFGTLDTDSLAEVTDAMEALREDGGRLIGVISHRPELTDRLPGCIRVLKGAGESTWQLERVG